MGLSKNFSFWTVSLLSFAVYIQKENDIIDLFDNFRFRIGRRVLNRANSMIENIAFQGNLFRKVSSRAGFNSSINEERVLYNLSK